MQQVKHWFWVLDSWFICVVSAFIILATVLSMALAGLIDKVQDPDAAILSREEKTITDFSVGLQVQVLPDRPMGIEFRKIGEDETVLIYEGR